MPEVDSKTVLVTGATGLVGGAVVLELLSAGWSVLALARAASDAGARDRVLRVLPATPEASSARLTGLAGEVTAPCLGLTAATLARLCAQRPAIFAVVHAAADTTFWGAGGGADVNVGGVEQALALAAALGVQEFHHVSTAFVAGSAATFGPGDFDAGQSFHNPYEQSKFAGEVRVRAQGWPFRRIIHRPAVVLGDSATGRTPSFRGVYSLLRVAAAQAEARAPSRHVPLTVQADPDGLRNLITADAVARAIAGTVGHANQALEVVHHVPEHPHTNASFAALVAAALGVDGFRVIPSGQTTPELGESLLPLGAYVDGEPRFQTSERGARSGVDVAAMRALLGYGKSSGWRSPEARTRRPRAAAAPDGLAMRYIREVMQPRLGTALLENVTLVSASFLVRVTGDNAAQFALRLEAGVLVEALMIGAAAESDGASDGAPSREFEVLLDADTFSEVIAGRCDPREKFFAGDIELTGDVEKALGMTNLLRQFFESCPYPAAPQGSMAQAVGGEHAHTP